MIVTPDNSHEEKKENRSKYHVELNRQRRCRYGTRHDMLDVKDERDESHHSRPPYRLYIRPPCGRAKPL
jgi:hypothetical protein